MASAARRPGGRRRPRARRRAGSAWSSPTCSCPASTGSACCEAARQANPVGLRRHRDRLRLARLRHPGGAPRRLRLPDQAVLARPARRHPAARPGPAGARGGEPAPDSADRPAGCDRTSGSRSWRGSSHRGPARRGSRPSLRERSTAGDVRLTVQRLTRRPARRRPDASAGARCRHSRPSPPRLRSWPTAVVSAVRSRDRASGHRSCPRALEERPSG